MMNERCGLLRQSLNVSGNVRRWDMSTPNLCAPPLTPPPNHFYPLDIFHFKIELHKRYLSSRKLYRGINWFLSLFL